MAKEIRIAQGGVIMRKPDARKRCICGKCDNIMLIIRFNNGTEWPISNKEFVAIKQAIKATHEHNIATDRYCYQNRQEIDVSEVL